MTDDGALFSLDTLRAATPARCTWHPGGPYPTATHQYVLAVDLLHPRWWTVRSTGTGLTARGGGRLALHTTGPAVCNDCATEPRHGDRIPGHVGHFTPNEATR